MTYSVHQHWDPLKVCIVGKSYPPEFYSYIINPKVRSVMERIAAETEEDYQKLINLLESFGVKILRPDIDNNFEIYNRKGKFLPPPMTPCDYTIMIGNTFYHNYCTRLSIYKDISAESWPKINNLNDFYLLPKSFQDEVNKTINQFDIKLDLEYEHILQEITDHGSITVERLTDVHHQLNRAMICRVGKDLYIGTEKYDVDINSLIHIYSQLFPEYRCNVINTGGHGDSTYCPVVPGLIVSLFDVPTYADLFPDWEVIYLPKQHWDAIPKFQKLKEKNRGKWWVPGEELNNEFTDYVESWLNHWVGYVEETVFDINMLVIDEKNVVCNNYNEKVFRAFERYGITPHVINFRHRYFWDGGLHCITSDIHREGSQKNYFPKRD